MRSSFYSEVRGCQIQGEIWVAPVVHPCSAWCGSWTVVYSWRKVTDTHAGGQARYCGQLLFFFQAETGYLCFTASHCYKRVTVNELIQGLATAPENTSAKSSKRVNEYCVAGVSLTWGNLINTELVQDWSVVTCAAQVLENQKIRFLGQSRKV